jgi:hypothetical protein
MMVSRKARGTSLTDGRGFFTAALIVLGHELHLSEELGRGGGDRRAYGLLEPPALCLRGPGLERLVVAQVEPCLPTRQV